MRKFRALLAALIAALLVGGVLATGATAGSLPKRIIDEVPPIAHKLLKGLAGRVRELDAKTYG